MTAKHKLYRLDSAGHSTLAEWKPESEAEIDVAARFFAELQSKGFTMFALRDESHDADRKLKAFDPEAREIVAVPQLVGG